MKSNRWVLGVAALASLWSIQDAAAIRVLVYDHFSNQHLAQQAAISIAPAGPGGTTVAGAANFNSQLTTNGPWDVVAIDCPGNIPDGGWQPTIDFVNGGGSCVMSFWDWDNSGGGGAPGLLPAFDLDFTIDKVTLVDGVTQFEATAAGLASGILNGVGNNNDWTDVWLDDGDQLGGLFSPGVSLGLIQGGSGIWRNGNGRAIACFVLDEAGPTWVNDARQLWKNMILHVSPTTCSADVNFDGSVGIGVPHTNLGPYQMTKFAADTPCPPDDVTSVVSPLGGSVGFYQSMARRSVNGGPVSDCPGWTTWSHGYTGDVYYTGAGQGTAPLTIVMPPATGAFYLYVEPENFGFFEFTAFSNGGATSGSFFVDGNGGAKYLGFYAPSGQLTSITVTNVDGNAGGFAVGEFGIARAGQIVFEDGPGTGAAPATLGPFVMNPFPVDSSCLIPTVSTVFTPVGGAIGFDASLDHYSVSGGAASSCPTWATWGHGYTGDVYYNDDTSVTLTMPPGTGAISLYIEPNITQEFQFVVTTNEGTSSGFFTIDGDGGARYVGFYANGGGDINSLTVVNSDGDSLGFAIGEFAIAKTACGLTCIGDLNADGLINGFDLATLLGQWTGAAAYSPCAPRKQPDLNGDCKIDGIDLALLLGLWGPCEF